MCVLVASIIGSMYLCVISSVGVFSSPVYAIFVISCPLFKSFTVTLNSNVALSPAGTDIVTPFSKSSMLISVSSPFSFKLFSTYVVPSGTLSCTRISPSIVPNVLSNFILYVISFPAVTVLALSGSDSFVAVIYAFFTVVCTVSFSVSSTVAVFVIGLVYIPVANSSTVTSKLTVKVPAVSPSFAVTLSVIPFARFSCVNSVLACPFIFMLPSTKFVPSGIVSCILTSLLKPPSFLTVIVYVIFSPSIT